MRRLLGALLLVLAVTAPAWATFPTVQIVTRQADSANTSHTFTLPSFNSGDLIITCLGIDLIPSVTWNTSGWTVLATLTPDAGNSSEAECRYRKMDGGEGSTLSFTFGSSEEVVFHAYRITGQHSTSAPESTVQQDAGGNGLPDPANLTPSWGSADTLWILFFVAQSAGTTVTTWATNYSTNGVSDSTGASGCMAGSSYRTNTASSEDIGSTTLSQSDRWVAIAIGVRPSAASAGSLVNSTPLKSLVGGGLVR